MLMEQDAPEAREAVIAAQSFSIEDFLAAEAAKDLLRFSTAGSVDDGKSTLIGRLLYDSRNVYEDQVKAVTGAASGTREPIIDFALLTDGLRAEREQGITIDVAYRYFATQKRKFIIADTPGHEQYTRNMATGASTADLAIILIDARKGILPQSRRHAYIASLLGIRHLVAAINKMDLVNFSEQVYRGIERDFAALVQQYGGADVVAIPVSALDGDNVVKPSARCLWYSGPTLLQHLESVPVWTDVAKRPFRMAVQRVIRPDQTYRGFAGKIASGTVRVGDRIVAQPSGHGSRIASITTFDGDLDEASAPLSIALTLDDEIDISRGDILADSNDQPQKADTLEVSLVWFDRHRLEANRPYILKHGATMSQARINRVLHRTNIHSLDDEAVSTLAMNDIGVVEVQLTRPLCFDTYAQNRAMGSFILIDPLSNATAAAGMIRRGIFSEPSGHRAKAALVYFGNGSEESIAALEQELLSRGIEVVRTSVVAEGTLRSLLLLGLTVLVGATPSADVVSSLSDYATLDAAEFDATSELVNALLPSQSRAAHD